MGTLGEYLSSARKAKGLDLHDAAQQTRISIHYLKALEEENFSKLPGEVFVKGFLKSYGRFLNLSETELTQRYGELKPRLQPLAAAAPAPDVEQAAAKEREKPAEIPLEPVAWGAVIVIAIMIFLFTAMPTKHVPPVQHTTTTPAPEGQAVVPVAQPQQPDKLYLEIIAQEDAWLLVRTDTSPQKKSILKKGESVIWSADERFLLSYSNAGAVKLLLNGEPLTFEGPKSVVVRDLSITAAGIVNQKSQPQQMKVAKPKLKPQSAPQSQSQPQPLTQIQPQPQNQIQPAEQPAAPVQHPQETPAPVPQEPATEQPVSPPPG